MIYDDELIKYGEVKVGGVYRKEILNCYAEDYKCVIIVPKSIPNVYLGDNTSNYKVKQIINNCNVNIGIKGLSGEFYCESIIIIEKV